MRPERLPRGRYFLTTSRLAAYSARALVSGAPRNAKSRLLEFFRRFYRKQHGYTCSSCRMALHFGLRGFGLRPGDEVLMTPITIPDMLNVILLEGLVPRFVDLNPRTHELDLEDLQRMAGARSRVLLVTHLSGVAQDMAPIRSFCDVHGIRLVEDVSQAHGATFRGRRMGESADLVIASLSTGKAVSALLGGVGLTSDPALQGRIESDLRERNLGRLPVGTLLARVRDNLKVDLLTHPRIFTELTWPALNLGERLGWIDVERLHQPLGDSVRARRDLFFEDTAIRRERLPEALFSDLSGWQAGLALEMSERLEGATRARQERARHFLGQLSPRARAVISLPGDPAAEHNYYHLPFHIGSGEKRSRVRAELFQAGYDTGGYGLPYCGDLPAFPECRETKAGALSLHQGTLFVPIDQRTPLSAIPGLAMAFNRSIENHDAV